MKTQWKSILAKTTIWLATEIVLNLVGLDNIADYSEFVFGREFIAASYTGSVITMVLPS